MSLKSSAARSGTQSKATRHTHRSKTSQAKPKRNTTDRRAGGNLTETPDTGAYTAMLSVDNGWKDKTDNFSTELETIKINGNPTTKE